jgi:murein DD-endopeptidase MepM/ murein hydrolase activator NlpD
LSKKNKLRKRTKILLTILTIISIGLILPQDFKMPVENATKNDFDKNSYWAYPWGKSITHKGVDIFARKGTKIYSATSGLVIFKGNKYPGGKFALVVGPKWRLYYYAHMDKVEISNFTWVNHNSVIGTVGNTGNAKNTPPHLHFTIATPIPYFWRIDNKVHGFWKMFILNPIDYM